VLSADSESHQSALSVTRSMSWCWTTTEHVISSVALSMTLTCCAVSQPMLSMHAGTPWKKWLHFRSAGLLHICICLLCRNSCLMRAPGAIELARSVSCFAVPRHSLSWYGHCAFAVAGPTAWNSLSDDLRDPTLSTDSFRRLLKTILFSEY